MKYSARKASRRLSQPKPGFVKKAQAGFKTNGKEFDYESCIADVFSQEPDWR